MTRKEIEIVGKLVDAAWRRDEASLQIWLQMLAIEVSREQRAAINMPLKS